MGNIKQNNKVGMLFIDFETSHRVRVHRTTTVSKDAPLLSEYKEAELIMRLVEEAFVNYPRYIHPYTRQDVSKYVPQTHCETPLPQWKRIEPLQPLLDEATQAEAKASKASGLISPDEYGELEVKGKG